MQGLMGWYCSQHRPLFFPTDAGELNGLWMQDCARPRASCLLLLVATFGGRVLSPKIINRCSGPVP